MTLLITGNGHSGTTFLARLLMELGCDFGQGDPPAAWTQGSQAMEHPEIQRASKAVVEGKLAMLGLASRTFPPYVKAPAIGWRLDDWLGAGLQVDAVIVCHRNVEDTLRSIERAGGGYGGFGTPTPERLYAQTGRLMTTLWDHGISHTILQFPYIVTAPVISTYCDLVEPLEPFDLGFSYEEFCTAHARRARPELVHFR